VKLNAREIALDILTRVEKGGAYSNLLIHQALDKHQDQEQRDRQLVTQLVYGTLQQQRLLDYYLEPLLKKPLSKLELWVKILLRLSLYQLVCLDRIPDHAVVNEAVQLAKKKGHKGIASLVNGVLRQFMRIPKRALTEISDPVKRLAMQTSHPDWMVKRWVSQLGCEKTADFCSFNNLAAPVTLRVNLLRTSRSELMNALFEEGFEVYELDEAPEGIYLESGGSPAKSDLFKRGYFTFQSESSMLVTHMLNPQSEMRVLDMCAAPGGKTTHIAEYMQGRGTLIANDLHAHKVRLITEQCERLGLHNVQAITGDARRLSERYEAEFDAILLDAPCSGLGVIRHKPDIKWQRQPSDIDSLANIQYELMSEAAKLLKPGGSLVYSTCTIEQMENNQVVTRFLKDQPSFELLQSRLILPSKRIADGFFLAKLMNKG